MNAKESWWKGLAVWAAIIVLIVLSFQLFNKQHKEEVVKYSDFVTALDREVDHPQRVLEVALRGDALRGDEILATLKDGSVMSTFAPFDENLRKQLRDKLDTKQIPLNYLRPDDGRFWANLSMWLPLVLVVLFMVMFLRNMQGAGGKALSFGKSRAKMMPENSNKYTFKDVAGIDEVKEECQEIVAFLKDHKKFHEIGARIPKGVLLMGPPGTGKTLLARALAGEAGVPFFHISGSDFVEMFVGVGASRVRDLFENAKKNAPCIVFVDEIDAVGRHRGAGLGGGHDEREQTLNQLLVEMDGFEPNEAVIVVAATNRPDVLDPALLRPGRFDRRLALSTPDVRGRKEIIKVHVKKVKSASDVNPEKLALGTPGFSGADLENLVNEAALWAVRRGAKLVSMKDFEAAKDKILMGPERKSMVMSKDVLAVTAYHEAGHALVSYFLKGKSKVHKLTIIPRGRALGVTAFLPEEDVYSHSKEDLLVEIAKMMGGRAAEEIKFNQVTTGASDDIKRATELARAMVTQYGMSGKLGPVNLADKNENPFLGKDFHEQRRHSEKLAYEIDMEVQRILNTQYELSKQVLTDHVDIFERVSKALLELETLESDEFLAIIQGASLEQIREIQKEKERNSNQPSEGSGDPIAVRPETPKSSPVVTPNPA